MEVLLGGGQLRLPNLVARSASGSFDPCARIGFPNQPVATAQQQASVSHGHKGQASDQAPAGSRG